MIREREYSSRSGFLSSYPPSPEERVSLSPARNTYISVPSRLLLPLCFSRQSNSPRSKQTNKQTQPPNYSPPTPHSLPNLLHLIPAIILVFPSPQTKLTYLSIHICAAASASPLITNLSKMNARHGTGNPCQSQSERERDR